MNGVGKPYEGKPHVRFDVAGDGDQAMVGILRHSQRKRGATDRPDLKLRRHPLTLRADRLTVVRRLWLVPVGYRLLNATGESGCGSFRR